MPRKQIIGPVVVLLALANCTSDKRRPETIRKTTSSTVGEPVSSSTTTTSHPGCPTAAELARRSKATPRTVAVTAPETLAFELRLEPPPADARPRITAAEAYRRAQRNLPADPGPDPTIALGLYSDDGFSHLNPDGTQTKLVQSRLAWVVRLRDAVIANGTGGPAPIPPQTLPPPPACMLGTTIAPVDARSGAVLNVHQEGSGVR
jgi:hypothetical protein